MKYKVNLENAKSLADIQKAYDKEVKRVYCQLKLNYPEEYVHRIIFEQIPLWIIAEKTANARLGYSNKHWINPKML
ncbi:hypothetical protein [Lactococcus garvieae]